MRGSGQLLGASGLEAAVVSDAKKSEHPVKIDQTEILPKSFKIGVWTGSGQFLGASGLQEASQTLPRRHVDASGEALGSISGRFWPLLAASWGNPGGAPGGVLARLENVLERFEGALGQVFLKGAKLKHFILDDIFSPIFI